jgi:TetR/AcrR family transcriptional regulator of autoinduction and epiphytic fitness
LLRGYQESGACATLRRVPRTRTELDRDAKVAEILDAAEARLRASGYRALSVVAIARELGLAQNAVYWYFPSKDDLFVAVLERMLRDIVARKPPRRGGVERQVEWFVDQLAELEPVRAAMHERARSSPVVAQFVAALDVTWHRMLTNVLGDRLPAEERELAVDTLLATISGVLAQRLPAARRLGIVRFALARLTAPSGRVR